MQNCRSIWICCVYNFLFEAISSFIQRTALHTVFLHTLSIFFCLFPQLKSIESLGLSSDIRQCYLLNKFSFGDAINTAKSTAMQCISDKMNEGKTIVDNAINDIQAAARDVSNGAQLITQCREFTVTFPSVAGLVAKVTCLSQVSFQLKIPRSFHFSEFN